MANCLERLLYETVTNDREENDPTINSTSSATVGSLVELVKVHKLNPNYVFTSQYSLTKRCYGKPLLYLAITFERADIVELLLSREVGGSPNCSRDPYNFETNVEDDPFKRTAIFQSLSMSSAEIFNMLLNAPAGCDALALDSFNCSLLWHAVNMAHLDKIYSLLKSPFGPKLVNLPDRCGLRPLHIAAINNDSAAAELLLSGGAMVDATQYEGATALCIAAKRGAVSVLKTLLMHGANSCHVPVESAVSERQRSAFDMTQDNYRRNRGNNVLMTPILLGLQSGPFRKSPEQVVSTLAILLACGAVLPRQYALPSFVPEPLVTKSRSPVSLQIKCALTIRKALMAKGHGRSVKQLALNLLSIIPEPLIEFICFDFLSQF